MFSLALLALPFSCPLSFAQENKFSSLTQEVLRAANNQDAFAALEKLKDAYIGEAKFTECVESLKALGSQLKTLEPAINYYIALTRYQQLKYLEARQEWDEYFSQGNNYRDQLSDAAEKTVAATDASDPLHIYARLLLWQFHKDQEDVFAEQALSYLVQSTLEYAKASADARPIKEVADKFTAYNEKGRAKELYSAYVEKLAASVKKDGELKDVAGAFYKEENPDLAETVYDLYLERLEKSSSKEELLSALKEIAAAFAYSDAPGPKDGAYAEKIFKKIEAVGGKEAFDERLMYLRAFNLDKTKEYAVAKDSYLYLIEKYPQTPYFDEAVFKIGIIYTYILRDIKSGRDYFSRLAEKQTLSPQVISSIYQLGLLKQWENDPAGAKQYYERLLQRAGENFTETVALTKERLKEIEGAEPIEYKLKTFLDVSLKENYPAYDATRLYLKTSPYRIKKEQEARVISLSEGMDSGCMQPQIQYLWSGHLGTARPSTEEAAFNTTYRHVGTKEINLVVISPAGILDRSIDMADAD